MILKYNTLLNVVSVEIEEKKSRFICTTGPIASEEEAIKFINQLKVKYWDASHNVYCYSVMASERNIIQRYSDDGEPTGTAGTPILQVIKHMQLQNIVVVVTRYFGGKLLGIPGLIRAYSKSAASGILEARICTKLLCRILEIICDYALFGKLRELIDSTENVSTKGIVYEEQITITVLVPIDILQEFKKKVIEITNSGVKLVDGETMYS